MIGLAILPDTLAGWCVLCGYPLAADDPPWVLAEVAEHLRDVHGDGSIA